MYSPFKLTNLLFSTTIAFVLFTIFRSTGPLSKIPGTHPSFVQESARIPKSSEQNASNDQKWSDVQKAKSNTSSSSSTTTSAVKTNQKTPEPDLVLLDLLDPVPRRNFTEFARYPPRNSNRTARHTSGTVLHEVENTFATFYCSAEVSKMNDVAASLRDPFFAAAQSLIWRILWSPYRSKYGIVVFVCPDTPLEIIQTFKGQGATVKEVDVLNKFVPKRLLPVERWRDQFTKLNFWQFVEYKKIAYLDADAFPIRNIDDIFDVVKERKCILEKLSIEDLALIRSHSTKDLCTYTFGGVDAFGDGEINGGVLVFAPNILMHKKLVRGAAMIEEYDTARMEQGLLHSTLAFGQDGPFPAQRISAIYNACPFYYKEHVKEGDLALDPMRVIHDKLWCPLCLLDRPELSQKWDLDWMAQSRFYDSKAFYLSRKQDLVGAR